MLQGEPPKRKARAMRRQIWPSFEGIIRSSFLIDERGKIIQAWYKISPQDTVPKAYEALGRRP